MIKIKINSQYIQLGQFLQITNFSSSGGESKILVKELKILVNDELENRRGRKLYPGDKVEIETKKFIIE